MAKRKPRKPAAASAPIRKQARASLPAELPRPDLTLWMMAGVIGVMLTRVLHEFAHWAVLRFGGVEGVHWRPTAVRFDGQASFWAMIEANHFPGAAQTAPLTVVGWSELAGPVISVALTWLAAGLARHADLRPWMAGLGLAAPLRLLAPAGFVALVVLRYMQGRPPHRQPGLDEASVELLLGIPAAFLLLVEAVVTAPAVRGIWLACDLEKQRTHAIALAAGLCFGCAVLAWIG